MVERLIEEVRRREKVIRLFPNIDSASRLIGVVLAERHEVGSTGWKYLGMAQFRNWKEQAQRPESEPKDSTERQPVMTTYRPLRSALLHNNRELINWPGGFLWY
jgi:hypothetical protein